MTVKVTDPSVLKRQFPHLDGVEDWRAQQSLRLLWDRIFDVEGRVQAIERTAQDLADATNAIDGRVTLADRKADEALAKGQFSKAEAQQIEEAAQLPSEAPMLLSVVNSRLTAGTPGSGTPWNLTVLYGATGQSKFTEAVVDDLRAADTTRWGHITKTGGQTGSVASGGDGHAVDAVNWKNPDGVTAEVYDIISSSGSVQWIFKGRDANQLALWKYPP